MTEAYYFAPISDLRIAQNPDDVEKSDHYQAIRKEINARLRAPDWHKVKQHAEQLGRETGFGLLSAAYYTVAIARIEGIEGLARGLEITLAAWLHPSQKIIAQHPSSLNSLNWMANRLIRTVKQSALSTRLLKYFYRAERACVALGGAVDVEMTGQQTLQSLLSKKIKEIEEQVPTTHSYAKKVQMSWNALKKITVLLLLVTLAFVFAIHAQKMLDVPVNQLLDQVVVPKLLTEKEVGEIQQTYRQQKMQQQQEQITTVYFDAIKQYLAQEKTASYAKAEQLLQTLSQLYPESPEIEAQKTQLRTLRLAQQDGLVRLSERFKQARTDMANLKQALQQLSLAERRALRIEKTVNQLESYAMSLSPLIGRALYIEESLKQGQYEVAQQEWEKLEQQVNALAWKVSDLKKTLQGTR